MKLNTVILDDDKPALELVKGYCKDSKLVNVVETFDNPLEFINASTSLDFDLCLLDVNLPLIDGLTIAKIIKGTPFIFVTAAKNRLDEALEVSPIDIVAKPVKQERLNLALEKTFSLVLAKRNIWENEYYKFFHLTKEDSVISLCSSDILFVESEKANPRNKVITIKNGQRHTLKGYTFEELQEFSPSLIKISKTECVSVKAVDIVEKNVMLLKGIEENGKPKQVALTRFCKKEIYNSMT